MGLMGPAHQLARLSSPLERPSVATYMPHLKPPARGLKLGHAGGQDIALTTNGLMLSHGLTDTHQLERQTVEVPSWVPRTP
jgi:hypothetical protein